MKKFRIMHGVSEVAGQGSYSVQGLKELGENAEMIVWIPNKFGYPYDISLNIDKNNKKLLPLYAMKMVGIFLYGLLKYDIFHFHYGRSFLLNKELKIFRLFRKKVFYEFHGSDARLDNVAHEKNPYYIVKDTDEIQKKIYNRNTKICKNADGIIIHDSELRPYLPEDLENVYYVPLRLNVSAFKTKYPEKDVKKITIVHAPSNPTVKGTEYVLKAIDNLKEKYDIDFILVQNKTQTEAKEIYKNADIIVDQILIGTYGVFALEGMALGKPVITYITDNMLENFPEELPIQSANQDTIETVLENLIKDSDLRYKVGVAGRKYVEDYHDYKKVAAYLKKIYKGVQQPVCSREAFKNVKNEL